MFIFKSYSECRNYSEVARKCNKNGYTGKKGKAFTCNSIRVIIKNKIYISYNNFHNASKKSKHDSIVSVRLFNKCNQKIS